MLLLRLLEAESMGSSLVMTSSSWPDSSTCVLELSWDLRCSKRSMGSDFLAWIKQEWWAKLSLILYQLSKTTLYTGELLLGSWDDHDVKMLDLLSCAACVFYVWFSPSTQNQARQCHIAHYFNKNYYRKKSQVLHVLCQKIWMLTIHLWDNPC